MNQLKGSAFKKSKPPASKGIGLHRVEVTKIPKGNSKGLLKNEATLRVWQYNVIIPNDQMSLDPYNC
jgi:hypothetical protein